jgi:hypothetical protein
MPPIYHPKARRLHNRNPRIIQNFVRRYKALATQHNPFQWVKDLVSRATYPLSFFLHKEYEELDQLCTKVVSVAEKQCRKLKKGQVAFSLAIQSACITILAWSLICNKLKGQKVSSRYIQRTLKKANIPISSLGKTVEEATSHLHEAYTHYYDIKKDHIQLWRDALEALLMLYQRQVTLRKRTSYSNFIN